MKLHLLILVLLLISYSNSFSQTRDYIVKGNNDTIYGEVNSPVFTEKKLIVNNVTYKLNSDSLKSYFKNGIIYRRIIRKEGTKPIWVQCIDDGKIKLYESVIKSKNMDPYINHQVTSTAITWYVQKDTSEIIQLKSTGFLDNAGHKKLLRSFFADNPSIYKEYNELNSFSFKTIRVLIDSYNRRARSKHF